MPPPVRSDGKKPSVPGVPSVAARPDNARAFAEAMRQLGGVQPLRGPARLVGAPKPLAPPAARARRDAATRAAPSMPAGEEAPGALTRLTALPRSGEGFAFVADGVDRAKLRALGDGTRRPDASLDLHGQTAAAAEARLLAFVRAAQQQGRRVLHVIHGRGLGSKEKGPVLRSLVLAVLTSGPLAPLVLAVVSAPPRLGGTGAAIILLRRR